MPKCKNCGNEFNGNFCPNCGTKADTKTVCPSCGAEVGGNSKFCPECGQPLSAAPTTRVQNAVAQTDELQNELYSLYKILEPVKELDLAGIAIDEKIAELTKPLPEVNQKFYIDFSRYAPFISVELDENFLTPSNKLDAKEWKKYIKDQKKKLYNYKFDPLTSSKYLAEYLYELFKANEDKVLSDLGASFLYYKMDYCFGYDRNSFYEQLLWDKKCKFTRRYKLIKVPYFINTYLREKLGDGLDSYLIRLFNELKGRNVGEAQLCDITMGYPSVDVANNYTMYFNQSDGYPEIRGRRPYNMYEVEKVAKEKTKKSIREKTELENSIAGLKKIRKNINAAIERYMQDVNEYIANNVKITPYNYASQWRSVTYFLHLIVNKRGRDIYEVVNQYEIDMKHKELTSALGDIHTEIRSQTKILGSKLDTINRSIIAQTDAITSAIWNQTRTLGKQLDSINYSVISTGASVVGAISELGKSMGQAMSNMQFNVSVS